MTVQEFEERLKSFLHRKPFQPFIVEYIHGERFEVDAPFVAWNAGGAAYIGPNKEVFFFDHSDVRQFLPAYSETQS
jgi:hypothetical protein